MGSERWSFTLDHLKHLAGDILAFLLLVGEHPHFDGRLPKVTSMISPIFDRIAGLGRLIVDHHAAGIGDLVGEGTPLDEAADL